MTGFCWRTLSRWKKRTGSPLQSGHFPQMPRKIDTEQKYGGYAMVDLLLFLSAGSAGSSAKKDGGAIFAYFGSRGMPVSSMIRIVWPLTRNLLIFEGST